MFDRFLVINVVFMVLSVLVQNSFLETNQERVAWHYSKGLEEKPFYGHKERVFCCSNIKYFSNKF